MKPLRSGPFLVAMVAVGCASGGEFRTVPLARWETVPAAERGEIDALVDARLATARAAEAAAIAAVLEATRALTVVRPRPTLGKPPTGWIAKLVTGHQRKVDALRGIERSRRAALEADLAWRQRRAAAASAQVAMVEADREFRRAVAIDDRSTDLDSVDLPRFRGQLAHAQARWYRSEAEVELAHGQMMRASHQLAAAKETFAQRVRAADPDLPLQLSRWFKASQLRRRGLRVVDRSAPLPCRRRTCFHQRPADTLYLTIAESRARR